MVEEDVDMPGVECKGHEFQPSVPKSEGEEGFINKQGLKKKLFKSGVGWETPEAGDEVAVKYGVKLEDGTIVAKLPEVGVEFYVKEGHFCPTIAHAVKTMKKGEKIILTVKPQCTFEILLA